MPDYKKLYFSLFNDVTDAIRQLETAQVAAEERYLEQCEEEDTAAPGDSDISDTP